MAGRAYSEPCKTSRIVKRSILDDGQGSKYAFPRSLHIKNKHNLLSGIFQIGWRWLLYIKYSTQLTFNFFKANNRNLEKGVTHVQN